MPGARLVSFGSMLEGCLPGRGRTGVLCLCVFCEFCSSVKVSCVLPLPVFPTSTINDSSFRAKYNHQVRRLPDLMEIWAMNIELALALWAQQTQNPWLHLYLYWRRLPWEVIPHDANGRVTEGHFMACVIFVYFNMICVPTPMTWRKQYVAVC